jgi:hypothetical protein
MEPAHDERQRVNVMAQLYLEPQIVMVNVRDLFPYARVRTLQPAGVKKVARLIYKHGFNSNTPVTACRRPVPPHGIVDGEHRVTAVIRLVEDDEKEEWDETSQIPVRFFKEDTPEWLLLAYAARMYSPSLDSYY